MKITYSKIPKAKIKRDKVIKYKRIRIEVKNIVRVEDPITHGYKYYDEEGHLVKYVAVEVDDWLSGFWDYEYGFVESKDEDEGTD